MKKTKVIIPALGILLLSTAASVTGTVAWFSMNDTVTASGMSITSKSDAAFLLIQAGEHTAGEVQAAKKTSDNAATASAELFPVAHKAIANTAAAEAHTESGEKDYLDNWYYEYSADPNLATGNGTELKIEKASFGNYVLMNQFSIAVAVGSNQVNNLKVKEAQITTAGDNAVKVLVTSSTGADEFWGASPAVGTEDEEGYIAPVAANLTGSKVLMSELTSDTVCVVNVYVYWDGNDSDVFTNGIADLKSTSVTLTFTGDIVNA